MRNFRAFLIAGVLFGMTPATKASEAGEAILYWNDQFLQAVRESSTAPGLASRNLAILHGALYDGLAGLEGRPPLLVENLSGGNGVNGEAFVHSASSLLISIFYPSRRGLLERKAEEQLEELGPEGRQISTTYARKVAAMALEKRKGDGAANTLTYIPKDEIGKWRRTPPAYRPPELSHWYHVEPFVLPSADAFRPEPPPPLSSSAYARAVEEVRRLGGRESTERAEEQTHIAEYWSCFSYTSTPAGHWNQILCGIFADRAGQYETLFVARAFALMNLATADAGIASWDCKYHYEFWRPVHAIRLADEDGNAATTTDAAWLPYLESPPHPEYVSGHSTFSGAGARMLALVFGTDKMEFFARNESFPDRPRRFTSFWDCAEECGRSRIYGGIHYEFSNRAGLELGRQVADYVFANAFTQNESS